MLLLSFSEKEKLGEPKEEIGNLKMDLNICLLVISRYNICNLNICILVILRYNISNLNICTLNILLGGPAQDFPKFQIPSLTPKSVQTCSIHSPDGDSKVSLKKMTSS
jgi:hypothetical protein